MISCSIVFCLPLTSYSLTMFSVSSLQFLLSIISPFFSPLSMSLLMQSSSQFRSSSPPFPFHFLGICSLCQFLIYHFSTIPARVLSSKQLDKTAENRRMDELRMEVVVKESLKRNCMVRSRLKWARHVKRKGQDNLAESRCLERGGQRRLGRPRM